MTLQDTLSPPDQELYARFWRMQGAELFHYPETGDDVARWRWNIRGAAGAKSEAEAYANIPAPEPSVWLKAWDTIGGRFFIASGLDGHGEPCVELRDNDSCECVEIKGPISEGLMRAVLAATIFIHESNQQA